jgi:hypothetical protein
MAAQGLSVSVQDAFCKHVEAIADEMTSWLQDIARIPTINPPGRIGGVDQCIAYGPGILDQAHLPDEYCLTEDVVNSTKVMALTAMQLLGAEEVSSKR